MSRFLGLITLVTIFQNSSPVSAAWRDIPLGVLVDDSALIFDAKVVKVVPDGEDHEFAILKVDHYLRDTTGAFAPELKIRQANRPVNSVTLRLKPNTKALFCLQKGDPLIFNHPSRAMPVTHAELVIEIMELRRNLAKGKSVEGWSLRAELLGTQWIPPGSGQEKPYYSVRLSLINTSGENKTLPRQEIIDSLSPSDENLVEEIGGDPKVWLGDDKIPDPNATVIFIGPIGRNTGAYAVKVDRITDESPLFFTCEIKGQQLQSNTLTIP